MAIDPQELETGDNSRTLFPFTFKYLKESDVKVTLDGVLQTQTTHYTFANATTIEFVTAPATGVAIRIYRDTDVDELRATFFPGSSIRASDLNNNLEQNNYAVQEIKAYTWDNETATIHSDENWASNDDQIATTQAIDERIDDKIDTAITSDIAGSDGVSITDDGDGTITIGLSDNSIDFAKIQDVDIINLSEQNAGAPAPADTNLFTASAAARRFDTLVQTDTPTGSQWETGKTWLQNDDDLTIRMWDGTQWVAVTSGGTFQTLDNVFYVSESGVDTNNGNRISAPLRTIGEALNRINTNNIDGATVVVYPGVYSEAFPLDIERSNVAIVGQSQRNCIIRPAIGVIDATATVNASQYRIRTVGTTDFTAIGAANNNIGTVFTATGAGTGTGTVEDIAVQAAYSAATPDANELSTMFRLNSGSYIANLTLQGMKASGVVGGNALDTNATHGVATNQGWNFAFFPDAVIRKSPYIQNCTNFSDSAIDNSLAAAAYQVQTNGAGGDITSGLAGGGLLVDGSVPAANSPLRSMVCDSYTHVSLNGPGILVTNNGYCQATSSYAFFNRYHIKCLNGGQANLAASTSDFGNFSLVAEGRSPNNIFTGELVGQIAAAAPGDAATTTFTIDTVTANTDLYGNPADPKAWFGDVERPRDNMVVELDGEWYEVRDAVANGAGWDVTIFRPDPTNRTINIGLDLTSSIADNTVASFFLRSQIASSGHTMEFVGSGTNYSALPENGGEPDPTAQITEVAANAGELVGKVYTAITDHNGNFQVGPLSVDQKNNTISIAANSGTLFAVSGDAAPQLGGNLDANGNDIILDTGAAATPSLTFTGDVDSGLFSGGANTVNITTGGVERAEFGAAEVVFNDGGEDYDFRVEGDTVTNLFQVDASADAVNINGNTTVSAPATLNINTNSVERAEFGTAEVVFNDGGENYDFRVEGDNQANLLFVDAGTDRIGIGDGAPGTAVEIHNTAPDITIRNTTEEDIDGGRESRVIFEGEQSGGEISTLARIEASHDGALDDQAGQLTISTNDGADGDVPTVAVTIDSAQNVTLANNLTVGTDLTVTGNATIPSINGGNQVQFADANVPAYRFENLIHNPTFSIQHRPSGNNWFCDRWRMTSVNFANGGYTTAVNGGDGPDGIDYFGEITTTTATTTNTANEIAYINQVVEAVNLIELKPGTADAQSVTLSFYVRTDTAGNYGVTLYKSQGTARSIGATYNISAAEADGTTWHRRTLTFPGDTDALGAFNYNTGIGYQVNWILQSGTNWLEDLSNWTTQANGADFVDDGHDVQLFNSHGDFALTGVQLEYGTTATPLKLRSWIEEARTCLRYYENNTGYLVGTYGGSGWTGYVIWSYKERKRKIPTFTFNGAGTASTVTTDSALVYNTPGYPIINSASIVDAETDWTP